MAEGREGDCRPGKLVGGYLGGCMDCYRLRMLYTVICKGRKETGQGQGEGEGEDLKGNYVCTT